jgi:cytochrome c peroxidase
MRMLVGSCFTLILVPAFCSQLFAAAVALPRVPFPANNPYSKASVDLGRNLFFDGRLSSNGIVSCAFCHKPQYVFSDNLPVSPGVDGQSTGRHSPPLINRAWGQTEFWDGRAPTLEDQVIIPITNPHEMGMTADGVVKKLSGIPGYAPMFAAAYGDKTITFQRVAMALANFVRTITSSNSAFDRYQAGDKTALSKEQKRGLDFFNVKGACDECHSGFNFTDEKFANLGIGFDRPNPDLGREVVTHRRGDTGRFKVPTLRDAARTPRFMHDGRYQSLGEVLDFYSKGGISNPHLDTRILPFFMDQQIKDDLLQFLDALNGEGWQSIKAPEHLPE